MRTALFLFFISIFNSCKENVSDHNNVQGTDTASPVNPTQPPVDEDTKEAVYLNAETDAVKKVVNTRFHYFFEIPAAWKAVDKSNNGDGFYIDCGNKNVDIRIYGEALEGNEITAELELQACDKTETYLFGNGYPGIKCIQDNDEYYYYDTPLTRIVCYINADAAWKKENMQLLNAMVKSITSMQENFN